MKINQDVLTALSLCQTEGDQLKLPGQLDRKLYVETNKVLEAAGGKWNRKTQAHLFDGDSTEIIDRIILSGEIATSQEFGCFFTPPAIVKHLIELAEVRPGMLVLEPSAGIGNIAMELFQIRANCDCIEILPKLCKQMYELGIYKTLEADFLSIESKPLYDRVVMNPPFAKQADIDHINHALRCLKPGGKLVSVMSAGVAFRENKKTTDFRNLIANHSGFIEKLPEGSFKESGTMVSTVIVGIPN